MKKMNILLLCAFLVAVLPKISYGEASNSMVMADGKTGIVSSACEINGQAYILSNLGVFRWDYSEKGPDPILDLSIYQKNGISPLAPGTPIERDLWEKSIGYLFVLNDQLYGLHPYSGQISLIREQQASPCASLPKAQFFYTDQDVLQPKEIISCEAVDDTLYLVLGSFTYEDGEVRELYAWNLSTPEMTPLNAPDLAAIFPGNASSLIARVISKESGTSTLWLYDISTQSYTRQLWDEAIEPGNGFVWDAATDTLCFTASNGKVKKAPPNGKAQTKAYMPLNFSSPSDQAYLSSQGGYVYVSGGSIFVRDISQEGEAEQDSVRVMGLLDPRIAVSFSSAHPDISLIIEQDFTDFQSIQQSMISGEAGIDLYILNTGRSYQDVRDKGYAAPLSASTDLKQWAEQIYSGIRDVLYLDGELVAFPASILPNVWTLNETKWNEFGLGEIPATFAELFDLAQTWETEYADEYPEYTLLQCSNGFKGIVCTMVKQYLLQHETSQSPVRFDTPEFKNALESAWAHRAYLQDAPELNPLIMTYYQYYGIGYNDADRVISIAPPALAEGVPRMTMATMDVFVLNPLSQSKDAAIEFLTFYAEHMDNANKYSLNATFNTPLRPASFESEQKEAMGKISYFEELLKKADDSEKADIQALIDQETKRYQLREVENWDISQESILIYQEIAKHLIVPLRSIYANDVGNEKDQVIDQVISRFADGQLSVEQFIREMNAKAQMIFQEGG